MSNSVIPEGDLQYVREYINQCFWKPAKMEQPHYYTVREWRPAQDADFVKTVEIIRQYGKKENFYRKQYIYLYVDGLKYWTMGYPLDVTIIINRCQEDRFYGRQLNDNN